MAPPSEPDVTALLREWSAGDREGARAAAAPRLRRAASAGGLLPALGAAGPHPPADRPRPRGLPAARRSAVRRRGQNRAHFFGIAAQMMRRILVDHARRRQAAKRDAGGAATSIADGRRRSRRPRPRAPRPRRGALTNLEALDPAAGAGRRAALLRRSDRRGDRRGRRASRRRRSSATGGPRGRGCAARSALDARRPEPMSPTLTPDALAAGQADSRRGPRACRPPDARRFIAGPAAATRSSTRERRVARGGRRTDGRSSRLSATAPSPGALRGPPSCRPARASASAPTS